ncbi:MAG: transglutaminase domain-containing protein, partial [Gemmataceae bacterium]
YRQVVPASDDSPRSFSDSGPTSAYLGGLASLPPSLQSPLQYWTIALLRRLSRQARYRLPEGVRAALAQSPDSFVIDQDDSASVAGVLSDYLATSGEFTYSLYRRRQDHSIDPVLDFLVNVKQGHCERFAAALALMLRSVGIPARVVKGFRGCESVGDGHYVVRHRHAHAWVEMLIPRKRGRGTRGEGRQRNPDLSRSSFFDWLELDPTPAASAPDASRFSLAYFWEGIQRFVHEGWQTLIVDYNAEEQADLWDMLQSSRRLSMLPWLALAAPVIVALFCLGVFLRRLLRPRRTRDVRLSDSPAFYQRLLHILGFVRLSDSTAFYQRLLHILGLYASLRPSFGQTPREYGATARNFLQAHPGLAALAELPIRVVDLFYRVRFGGQPLREDERQTLDAELDHFAEVLRTEPRP